MIRKKGVDFQGEGKAPWSPRQRHSYLWNTWSCAESV